MKETFSPNNLAIKFNVDRATAVRILKDVEPDEERTRGRATFSIATFSDALQIHRAKNASNNDGSAAANGETSNANTLTTARIRIANASAAAKEMQNAIMEGRYSDIETAVDCFTQAMRVMREVLLTLPGKLADRLAADDDRAEVFKILYDEVCNALTALSTPETYTAAGIKVAQLYMSRAAPPPAPPEKGSDDV
jgi:hypothetical protein